MHDLIIALLENPEHAVKVRDSFEREGHGLEVVNSFSRAMKALNARSFNLIISDVHLQNGGSVYDFLKWTKSQEHLRAIPFVLFSLEPSKLAKYLADGVRTSARQMGAAKYISMEKFDAGFLRKEVAELLSGRFDDHVVAKEGK